MADRLEQPSIWLPPAGQLGQTENPVRGEAVKAIEHYLRFTDWLNAKFAWIVAFLICPMLFIMIWEIVMRYFFNSPSQWAYEISLFLYGAYIALGGAYTHLASGHVNVDIIWGKLSQRGRAMLDILTSGFAFLFLGVLFWVSLKITINSWQIGETTMSHWKPIYYPLRTTLPVGCFLFLMQVVAKLIRDVLIVVKGEDVFPIREQLP
jgi:TRAP-type mannitol/chloroaromatic compound transport system permease small subunit